MRSLRLFVAFLGVTLLLNPTRADDSPHKHHGSPEKGAIAGKADVLKRLPKKFAKLIDVDFEERRVSSLVDGDDAPETWSINADAEIKIHGWWGHLGQMRAGDRVSLF